MYDHLRYLYDAWWSKIGTKEGERLWKEVEAHGWFQLTENQRKAIRDGIPIEPERPTPPAPIQGSLL